jgi:hypothetical protein
MSDFYDPEEYLNFIARKQETIRGALNTRRLIRDFVENKITEEIVQAEMNERQQKPTTSLLGRISMKLGADEDFDDKDPEVQKQKRLNNNLSSRMKSLSAGLTDIRDTIKNSQTPGVNIDLSDLKAKFDQQTAGIKEITKDLKSQTPQTIQEVRQSLENLVDMVANIDEANVSNDPNVSKLVSNVAVSYQDLVEAAESLGEEPPIFTDDAPPPPPMPVPKEKKSKSAAKKVDDDDNLSKDGSKKKKTAFFNPAEALAVKLKKAPPKETVAVQPSAIQTQATKLKPTPTKAATPKKVSDLEAKMLKRRQAVSNTDDNDDDDDWIPPKSKGKGVVKPARTAGKTSISPKQLVELQNADVAETTITKAGLPKKTGLSNGLVRNNWLGDVYVDVPRLTSELHLVARLGEKGRPIINRKVDNSTVDLLLKNFNAKKKYTDIAWDTLGMLMAKSGATFRPGQKMTLVEPYMLKYLKKSTKTPSTGSGIKFYANKKELADRKKVLVGSVHSGNNNPKVINEISEIETVLKKNK